MGASVILVLLLLRVKLGVLKFVFVGSGGLVKFVEDGLPKLLVDLSSKLFFTWIISELLFDVNNMQLLICLDVESLLSIDFDFGLDFESFGDTIIVVFNYIF